MPIPLAAIAIGAQVTGSLLNAYSQVSAYEEQKTTTKYNKAIIDANTRIDNALVDMDIQRIREEGEEFLGVQRAMMGKSGTKFSGSNLDVFMDSLRNINMDVQTMEINKLASSNRAAQEKQFLDYDLEQSKKALPLKIAGGFLNTASSIAGSQSTRIAQSQVPPSVNTSVK
jgi:hypothetical protein